MRCPAAFLALLLTLAATAQPPQHIAPTPPKTPAEERAAFKVPPRFEVQLVASEPDIQKPIQHAFDARGRLWVTTSHSYPFPDPNPHDKLFVLSDFAPDGKAKTIATFAADLNIPIGVLPLPDGKSCIVSEVGRIVKLTDTDGDGKADKKEVLFTGFGTRDTHGMTNSFTLMPDGWVYACHGYLNTSKVKGTDGHEVVMNSGNTFRFRPDGSRIEVFTRGQVNPFGIAVDPWGNLYTADCHTKPITQLIRGAVYDSFGKPHDGLGYAPHVTDHDHGSTALCGLAWYDADQFPPFYKGTMFLGNVVTNRVNFDKMSWNGATPVAKEQPDFMVSGDPWFRPTDIKVGPDGALYVADFYNRIIGHYEVDLKHPGRDKDRGRIWRVVYKGEKGGQKPDEAPDHLAEVKKLRELAARDKLTHNERIDVVTALTASPRVARAAVDVLTAHPDDFNIPPLMDLIAAVPPGDSHLRHAARVALRNHLTPDGWKAAVAAADATPARKPILDDVSLGSPTEASAGWLVGRLSVPDSPMPNAERALEHIGRYGSPGDRVTAARLLDAVTDTRQQIARFVALRRGTEAAGSGPFPPPSDAMRDKISASLKATDDRRIRQGLELAAAAGVPVEQPAFDFLKDRTRSEAVRSAALTHLSARGPVEGLVPTCGELAADAATPAGLRDQALAVFANSKRPADQAALAAMLKDAPYKRAAVIAAGLGSSKAGAEVLFAAVKAGHASPRLLQEKPVLDRLKAANVPDLNSKVAALTAGLPSAEARLQQLITARTSGVAKAMGDVELGKKVYATHCAACHQMGGQGGKVGPNLDGIGNRGADRLLEDVLDPNRNVDAAFRASTLNLADGRVLTGLVVREEGAVLILADAEGKEQRIPKADVEKRTTTAASPMPANVGEKVPEPDFYHLMAYLLAQRVKQ